MKTRSQTNSLPPTPKRFNGIKYLTSLNDDEFSEDTTSQVTRFRMSVAPVPQVRPAVVDYDSTESEDEGEVVSDTMYESNSASEEVSDSETDDGDNSDDSDYVEHYQHYQHYQPVDSVTRYTPDGEGPYNKQQFLSKFGGTEEWNLMGKWERDGNWGSEYAEPPTEVGVVKSESDNESEQSSLDSSVVVIEIEKSKKEAPALKVPLTVRGIAEHMAQLLEEDTVSVSSLRDDLRALKTLLG